MTTIKFNDHEIVPEIIINGRLHFVRRITELRRIGPGRFEGMANGHRFEIEGGKHAGGRSTDWFVEWDSIFKTIPCRSATECIRMIETC